MPNATPERLQRPPAAQRLPPPVIPLTEQECEAIDLAMLADKLADGYSQRHERRGFLLQIKHQNPHWS